MATDLKEVIAPLTGTDDDDMAKSVIDFGLYDINEDKTLGDAQFYMVASEVIITSIAFIGPFTMMELDFRNVGYGMLQQIMGVISRFHENINSSAIMLLSTITSLEHDAKYVLSLANPLTCVRGYSDEGEGTTILQLIYATDNIAFTEYEIDFDKVDADIEREVRELEAMSVTSEEVAAAQETIDEIENNEEMKEMFKPEFGFRTPLDKMKRNTSDGIRVSNGSDVTRVHKRDLSMVGDSDKNRVSSIHDTDEEESEE